MLAYRGFAGGHWLLSKEAGAAADAVTRGQEEVAYAATIQGEEWTAEWSIPYASLGVTATRGQKLLFNITVRKPGDSLWLMWQGTGGYSWQVEKAGWLHLP